MNPMRAELSLDRLKAMTDGVVAIVLTILVLDLDVPSRAELQSRGAWGMLMLMEGQLRPYVSSFASVASIWLTQMVILQFIQRGSRAFIWLNLVLLLFLSIHPFLNELRAAHMGNTSLAFLFAGVQIICFLLLLWIWHYTIRQLVDKRPSKAVVHSLDLRIWGAIALYIIGASLVAVNERIATAFFVSVPLLFVTHRSFDAASEADAMASR